jgi:short-subunit dehydrogenase
MNIIITGATKGIGRAIAERFAATGFDLIVCARREKDLALMKATLEKKYKIKCHTFSCNVGDRQSLNSFIEFIKGKFKRIDVLVNNAGLFRPGSILTEEEGLLEELMNVNVLSAYHLTRGIIGLLKKSNKPHIFNMSSIAGIAAYNNGGSYAITKHALQGLTKNLREELKGDNIRVTAVIPGATWSDSWKGVSIPKKRFIPAEDIAEMIFAAYSLRQQAVVEEIIIRPLKGDIREEEFG